MSWLSPTPPSRQRALRALRLRLRGTRRWWVDERRRALAEEARALKAEISEALGEVQACRGCAKGHPLPAGRWEGGHCCSGNEAEIFSEAELSLLSSGGTRARHLRPPRAEHAGCAFRGPTGCSLRHRHRPVMCLRYTCTELARELAQRGDLAHIEALGDRLNAVLRAHRALDEG